MHRIEQVSGGTACTCLSSHLDYHCLREQQRQGDTFPDGTSRLDHANVLFTLTTRIGTNGETNVDISAKEKEEKEETKVVNAVALSA